MANPRITLIPGDGIGPEITASVKAVFEAASVPVEWEEQNAGQTTFETQGELLPGSLIESLKRNRIGLKGPITTPVGKGFKSINIQLRQRFDLYANVRPAKSIPGMKSRFDNVDLILFRENTEGLYAGLEHFDERLQVVDSIARISETGCKNILTAAFDYARNNGRKKVTVVHKANILKKAGAMLLDTAATIAKEYPEVTMEDVIIDNMCMQLVTRPERYDVVVTTNLFGDILSDLAAGLVGGLGVVSGANIGKDAAIFEAVHGSAPDIAGKGLANPTALLKSAVMMLEYLGEGERAKEIAAAIDKTLADPAKCTRDIGGTASTREFTENVIANL